MYLLEKIAKVREIILGEGYPTESVSLEIVPRVVWMAYTSSCASNIAFLLLGALQGVHPWSGGGCAGAGSTTGCTLTASQMHPMQHLRTQLQLRGGSVTKQKKTAKPSKEKHSESLSEDEEVDVASLMKRVKAAIKVARADDVTTDNDDNERESSDEDRPTAREKNAKPVCKGGETKSEKKTTKRTKVDEWLDELKAGTSKKTGKKAKAKKISVDKEESNVSSADKEDREDETAEESSSTDGEEEKEEEEEELEKAKAADEGGEPDDAEMAKNKKREKKKRVRAHI